MDSKLPITNLLDTPARTAILEALSHATEPLTTQELAAASDLAPSTIRANRDQLHADGLIDHLQRDDGTHTHQLTDTEVCRRFQALSKAGREYQIARENQRAETVRDFKR